MNTHTIVADMHQNMLKTRGEAGSQDLFVSVARSHLVPLQNKS